MIRIYQKAKVPTQNPWCDICGKDDCDKIICGFTTCEVNQKTTELYKAATDLHNWFRRRWIFEPIDDKRPNLEPLWLALKSFDYDNQD